MNTFKLSALLLLLLVVATSCKTKKNATATETETAEVIDDKVKMIHMTESMLLPKPIDAVNIKSVSIKGDILILDVAYSGCAEHDFVLYGNRAYRKSLPPKIGLALVHDAHGDKCRKLSTQKLYFNIRNIRYPGKDKDYTVVVYVNQDPGNFVDYKY